MEEYEFKIMAYAREEGVHRSGLALVLSQSTQRALVGYNTISDMEVTDCKYHKQHDQILVVYWRVDSHPRLSANGRHARCKQETTPEIILF